MAVLLVVLGLVALVGGSELVVRGASRLAKRLGIPSLVVGLTVVSIGTSAPELAVGIDAGWRGVGELAVGTVTGSNVVNLLLILGLSALILPLTLRSQTLRLDLPAMAAVAVIALLMGFDGELSWVDGVVLLVLAVLYTLLVFRISKRGQPPPEDDAAGDDRAGGNILVSVLALVAGLAVIVLGAEWLVNGAVDIAQRLGVSDALIGLTIVAIGTSSPEIATTVVSTIRGERDVAIGNLIGSCVYNVLLILGVTALAAAPEGVALGREMVAIDLPVMAGVALLCIPVFMTGRRVTRLEGGLFVAAYVAYLAFLLATRL